ncbi:hypothetical protein [Luteipulveratus halotolerans]|uniref:Uncharacterized protein n=1 Tax=Luteipulveratus halotolerans TaxID=1631356 RepID=A0A0L6CJ30_9MICO|nr:hypothetical protein [Luteipulveratus halotolerans]KNX37806.1 hypothetical protein VV01_12640 [Luteipulveratus halotolerans]
MRARLLAVLTTCLLGCAVVVGAPMAEAEPVASPTADAPADSADDAGFTVRGQQLDLRTSLGSAPQVEPGLYRATLPAGKSTTYAKIQRRPGETLNVAVSGAALEPGKPYFATADHRLAADFVIPSEYGTPTTCGRSSSSAGTYLSSGDAFGVLTATNTAEGAKTPRTIAPNDECYQATTLYIEISREAPPAAGAMPVEIQVTREPKITGTPDQPVTKADLAKLQTLPKDDDVVVAPGRGYSDAPELKPDGTTRLDVRLGETYFYKVRVGWGQRLGASLDVPGRAAPKAPQVDTEVSLGLRNPMRQGVGSTTSSQSAQQPGDDTAITPDVAEVSTAPVRWANRSVDSTLYGDISSDSAQATTAAGWYYVVVRADPSDSAETKTGVAPYRTQLTVQVTGTAGSGPTFVDASNQAMPAPKPGELSIGGQDGGSGSSLPWARIGGGIAAALLAALAVAWALRARRNA